MLSNWYEFVGIDGTGETAQARFKNYWGIGPVTPFSQEVRFNKQECESLLVSLKTESSSNARRSQISVKVALERISDLQQ